MFDVRALAVLLGTILLVGCSGAPKQPDWVDNPDLVYPSDIYLTATGSSSERDSASDRARANLAKIFEVAVQESTLDFSKATVTTVAAEEGTVQATSNEQSVARTVSTEARQVLEGTEVPEYWQSADGRIYAIAVLEKRPAAGRFRQEILEQDRQVNDLVGYAVNKADNPVAALNALQDARAIQVVRDANNQNLMILTAGKGVRGQYDLAEIDGLIRQGLSQLRVAVRAEDPEVKAQLEKALATLGVQNAADSNLQLAGRMDTGPVEQKQGWYWLRGAYELEFTDDGSVLAKDRWTIKVSATDQSVLMPRARDDINANLPSYVYELLSAQPN